MTELGETTATTAPEALDLAELRRAVTGPVFAPGDVETVTELAG
jgi:hypothetical protein